MAEFVRQSFIDFGGGAGGSGGGGALAVPDEYFFVSDIARDGYFGANPSKLIEGVSVVTNGMLQQYKSGVWVDMAVFSRGQKGDQGDPGAPGVSSYIHVRWGDSDTPSILLTTPDEYIGVYTGTSDTAPTTYSGYTWYKWKGDKGIKGDQGEKGVSLVEYEQNKGYEKDALVYLGDIVYRVVDDFTSDASFNIEADIAAGYLKAVSSPVPDGEFVKIESALPQELDTSLVFSEDNEISYTDKDGVKRKTLSLGEYEDNRVLFSDVTVGMNLSGKKIVFDTTKQIQIGTGYTEITFSGGSNRSMYFINSSGGVIRIYVSSPTPTIIYSAGSWLTDHYIFPEDFMVAGFSYNSGGFQQDDPYLKLSDCYICDVEESIELGDVDKHLRLQTCETTEYGDHVTAKTPSGVKKLAYVDELPVVPAAFVLPDDVSKVYNETLTKSKLASRLQIGNVIDEIEFDNTSNGNDFLQALSVGSKLEFTDTVTGGIITISKDTSDTISYSNSDTSEYHVMVDQGVWQWAYLFTFANPVEVTDITGVFADLSASGTMNNVDMTYIASVKYSVGKRWDNEQILEEARKSGIPGVYNQVTNPSNEFEFDDIQGFFDGMVNNRVFDDDVTINITETSPKDLYLYNVSLAKGVFSINTTVKVCPQFFMRDCRAVTHFNLDLAGGLAFDLFELRSNAGQFGIFGDAEIDHINFVGNLAISIGGKMESPYAWIANGTFFVQSGGEFHTNSLTNHSTMFIESGGQFNYDNLQTNSRGFISDNNPNHPLDTFARKGDVVEKAISVKPDYSKVGQAYGTMPGGNLLDIADPTRVLTITENGTVNIRVHSVSNAVNPFSILVNGVTNISAWQSAATGALNDIYVYCYTLPVSKDDTLQLYPSQSVYDDIAQLECYFIPDKKIDELDFLPKIAVNSGYDYDSPEDIMPLFVPTPGGPEFQIDKTGLISWKVVGNSSVITTSRIDFFVNNKLVQSYCDQTQPNSNVCADVFPISKGQWLRYQETGAPFDEIYIEFIPEKTEDAVFVGATAGTEVGEVKIDPVTKIAKTIGVGNKWIPQNAYPSMVDMVMAEGEGSYSVWGDTPWPDIPPDGVMHMGWIIEVKKFTNQPVMPLEYHLRVSQNLSKMQWEGSIDATAITPVITWRHVTPLDYTYTRQDTGQLWADGRKIYQKTTNWTIPALTPGQYHILESDIRNSVPEFTHLIKSEARSTHGSLHWLGMYCLYQDNPELVILNESSVTTVAMNINVTMWYLID